MATTNANDVKNDAANVLKVWGANPDFKLKDLTLEQFQSDYAALTTALDNIQKKEDELTPLRNQRDDLSGKVNGYCTRARAGIKGYFGENSNEYELAGGTRASEIKRGGARGKAAPTPAK